jgi:hypothetical protein
LHPTLKERIDELDRGLLSTGVPVDVAQRGQRWLKSTAEAMNRSLGRPAETAGSERSVTAPSDAARVRRSALRDSTDVAWLCATARGAGLLERRAAFARLAVLAPTAERAERACVEALLARRHAGELGLDETRLAVALGGTPSRAARDRLEAAAELGTRFAGAVHEFVDGIAAQEPLSAMPQSARTELLLHLRAQPAEVAAWIASEIERALASETIDAVIDLLGALRPAADRRMLPTLARIVHDDARPEVRAAAASALSRIDDPRVARTLTAAWHRASDVVERLVLAEGLGLWSDRRGEEDVRIALDESDDLVQKLALAALTALADPNLAEAAYQLAIQSRSREVRVAAVRAIGRAADARGLTWLEAIEQAGSVPEVLNAALAMAKDGILARLEARGEIAPAKYERRADPLERALARPPGAPATGAHRLLARWTLVRARIARIFGRSRSAANAYARAAAIAPTFYLPPLIEARWRLGMDDLPEAVRCFRRLIAFDPAALSRRPRDLAAAVQALLRRADELEQRGRHEMAREIHEELFGLDLTSCAPSLRVEVRRRRDRPMLTRTSSASHSGPWPAQPEVT